MAYKIFFLIVPFKDRLVKEMFEKSDYDRLRDEQQEAYNKKQDAYKKYDEARTLTEEAYKIMQDAWEERSNARQEMNCEFEARQALFKKNDVIWDEYKALRDANNAKIELLRQESDVEHRAMITCFEQSSVAYESGKKNESSMYASEARDHKDRRDALNDEVASLVKEIKDAKAHAEVVAPKVDSAAFHAARERFVLAKEKHEAAQAEFKAAKTERDRLKEEFNWRQQEFLRAKEAFQEVKKR